MAVLDKIQAKALSVQLIPRVEEDFARRLNLTPLQLSVGLITSNNDDATYVAVDHATKMADVEVVYAHSFYAGSKHASGLLSGEIIAILAGPNPYEVNEGLKAAVDYLETEAFWYSANEVSRRHTDRLPGRPANRGTGGARRSPESRGCFHRCAYDATF